MLRLLQARSCLCYAARAALHGQYEPFVPQIFCSALSSRAALPVVARVPSCSHGFQAVRPEPGALRLGAWRIGSFDLCGNT